MSIVQRFFGGNLATVTATSLAYYYEASDDARAFYDLLRAYYVNNGLYDELRDALSVTNMEDEALKPLRNPASRVVEFYASKLWPGALPDGLPIETENVGVAEAIERVWEWSNWGSQKQVAARWLALYGDWFLKVATRMDVNGRVERVFLQSIDPRYVPEFDTDERGFLTYFRADVPQMRRSGDDVERFTYTEVWDKGADRFRTWEHDKGEWVDIEQLEPPKADLEMTGTFGFDFVPVVHVKFRDIGDERGDGAFAHALDKIDEGNRLATRLHQMLFRHNRNLWALKANQVDRDGRPIPAPTLGSDGSSELEVGDNTVVRLPGNSELQSMVPDLKYEAASVILRDHLMELEQDLPELAYFRLKERTGELSGRAVKMLLGDAVDRVLEARGNAETGLARAHGMALTMGGIGRLEGFQALGKFEAGDFEHSFQSRDVIPMDEWERAEVFGKYVQAGMGMTTAMRRAGFGDDEILQAQADKQLEVAQAQSSLALALLEQQRGFDQEGAGTAPVQRG
jgi:hypothetical protein